MATNGIGFFCDVLARKGTIVVENPNHQTACDFYAAILDQRRVTAGLLKCTPKVSNITYGELDRSKELQSSGYSCM